MIKEVLIDRHLDRLRHQAVKPENICPVKKLKDVLIFPPFIGSQSVYTFCDLDGVALSFSLRKGAHFDSLLALARIAKASQELTLWSLRPQVADNFLSGIFERKSISCLPIISKRSIDRLGEFFDRVAPETKINFSFGLDKLAKEGLVPQVGQLLNYSDKEIVLIGSSLFDRLEMEKLFAQSPQKRQNRLWYFDTGRIFL